MRSPLILVGGGGHCKSVIEVAESAGYEIKGILDVPETFGKRILDYEVIGNDNDIPKYVDICDFVITLGFIKDPSLRIKLHNLVEKAGGRFATIIASTANVSRYALIGDGTVILHQANVNADAKIGKSVIINSCSNIEHDVEIGDFCHISTGVMINGNCRVNENCFIGSQSILNQGVTIVSNSIIGAGSVVIRNILEDGIYVGNPAKKIEDAT